MTRSPEWRELATRQGDGLEISLLWSKSADRVKVSVLDQKREESFEIHIDAAEALSAFEHPFAYARSRTVTARETVHSRQTLRQQA